jgi:ectoine hydroxylase-related dioxygenase (phytanoyl-CoA dioxygenase family)
MTTTRTGKPKCIHQDVLHFLTPEERQAFWDNGYIGPYRALEPVVMEHIREQIIHQVIGADADQIGPAVQCRHLDSRIVYDLCANPAIIERIAQLYGPNLILWRSNFWCKQPGGAEVCWHQDLTHWPLEPPVSITAWIALDPATRENSCVQLIPGSHKAVYPTAPLTGDPLRDSVRSDCVDHSRVLDMELEPGEFFLFSERLLHHSNANRSNRRRLGLAVRVTLPFVKVDHDRLCGGRHRNIVLRGVDDMGFNKLQDPPLPSIESRRIPNA